MATVSVLLLVSPSLALWVQIPYLAPEMEATTYDQAVDMWACGIFGNSLFVTKGRLTWDNVVEEKIEYDSTLANLQAHPTTSIENLLSRMLAWNPAERISARSALLHPCFSSLLRTDHSPRTGQKRVRY